MNCDENDVCRAELATLALVLEDQSGELADAVADRT
jgi:hypothetical protein